MCVVCDVLYMSFGRLTSSLFVLCEFVYELRWYVLDKLLGSFIKGPQVRAGAGIHRGDHSAGLCRNTM